MLEQKYRTGKEGGGKHTTRNVRVVVFGQARMWCVVSGVVWCGVVCVCVSERERQRDRDRQAGRETETERQIVCARKNHCNQPNGTGARQKRANRPRDAIQAKYKNISCAYGVYYLPSSKAALFQ